MEYCLSLSILITLIVFIKRFDAWKDENQSILNRILSIVEEKDKLNKKG